MKMTVATIVEEARSGWVEPTEAFITATETLRWFNLAQAEFVSRTKCLRDTFAINTVADQQEYPFAVDVVEILWVVVDGEPLTAVTREELDAHNIKWRQSAGGSAGLPYFYYITGVADYDSDAVGTRTDVDTQMGFYYCPDDIYAASIYYVRNPAIITAGNDAFFPEIPEKWHHHLIHYIEMRGHKKNRNWEMYGAAKKDWESAIKEATMQQNHIQPDKIHVMSGPEIRGQRRTLRSRIDWDSLA